MNQKIIVIGCGLMGPGIAARAALAGHPTILVGRSPGKALAGREQALRLIGQLAEHGLVEPAQITAAGELLTTNITWEPHLSDALLVIEAVTEDLALKQQLFRELDAVAPPQVILASNTSGLQISRIAQFTSCPERTITTHFWFPGHLIPLVEVVMGERTDEAVALRVRDLLRGWGKAPVIVRQDLPGQLANRILQAIIREAANIVQMGLASPEDVDTAIKMGMAVRLPVWGPLEHIDAVGLDLALSVQQSVLPGLNNDSQPPANLRALVENGSLGFKSGHGFYDWHIKDMAHLADTRDRFIIETLRTLRNLDVMPS